MSLTLITAPTELPVTLDEVKDQLQINDTISDAPIAQYIASAIDYLDGSDGVLGRALCSQTWELAVDCFPGRFGRINLPLPPLQSVSSINYIDTDGNTQLLSASIYDVKNVNNKTRNGFIELAYDQVWPTTRSQSQAVTIQFVAGYGSRNDVPEKTKHLIMYLVRHFYDNRGIMIPGALKEDFAYKGLLSASTGEMLG